MNYLHQHIKFYTVAEGIKKKDEVLEFYYSLNVKNHYRDDFHEDLMEISKKIRDLNLKNKAIILNSAPTTDLQPGEEE